MKLHALFAAHIDRLQSSYQQALQQQNSDRVLIHSGSEDYYYADDQAINFQAFGHFSHWLPVTRPDQFILIQPGYKPVYYQLVPDDFWYDQTISTEDWWLDQFEVITLSSIKDFQSSLNQTDKLIYIGPNQKLAKSLGIPDSKLNPASLLNALDYNRAYKSPYEIAQLKAASELAMKGHHAAAKCFSLGGNEYQIHMAFLTACNILEQQSPYTNIVAVDEKAAILHYQHKRQNHKKGQVLLIDAGCRINGYCSDITRTTVSTNCQPVFSDLVQSMVALELSLVASVKPGMPYQNLHAQALLGVATILLHHDICKGSVDELMKQRIPHLFMPHGVGHLLGIQVHDVGGKLVSASGEQLPSPVESPALRNTRVMEEDMVFTVEPGLYFIPLLLNPERSGKKAKLINWALVDELLPLGGMRIEDNIVVRADGGENLTRGSD